MITKHERALAAPHCLNTLVAYLNEQDIFSRPVQGENIPLSC
jgi:hypothetical protein